MLAPHAAGARVPLLGRESRGVARLGAVPSEVRGDGSRGGRLLLFGGATGDGGGGSDEDGRRRKDRKDQGNTKG